MSETEQVQGLGPYQSDSSGSNTQGTINATKSSNVAKIKGKKLGTPTNSPEHSSRPRGKKPSRTSSSQVRQGLANRRKNKREDMLAQEFSNLSMYIKESKVNSTGLSYDERMVEHSCMWDPNYPERPERFSLPLKRCKEYNLIDRCTFVPCRPATHEELLLQHSSDVIDIIKSTKGCTDEEKLEKLSSKYDALYFHPSTYELALLAVGSTIDLVTQVVTGKVKNAMGIIRPPGHHAMYSEPCGYCFFNNVAIAAKHAVEHLGLKRVLIVDWDVHHGQASQYMFYDDPRVLYFSIHRYEHGAFWPNLRESNYDYVGNGLGQGYNFNVPLNKAGMGNDEYLTIFHQLLLPIAYEFSPELILVSSGYDAALGCFEGCMEVTPACYSHLLSLLMGLADGKICVILEGGYCLKSLAEGVALTLRTLLGDPCPSIEPVAAPCQELVDTILDIIYVHRPFWKCFQFQGKFSEDECDEEDNKRPRHKPKIQFFGSDVKPTSYETRNCYPVQTPEEIQMLNQRLDDLIANTQLAVPLHRTCFVYDDRMLLHKNLVEISHPEKPERLSSIYNILKEYGILTKCYLLKSRAATEEELALVHSKNYIDLMKATTFAKPNDLSKFQQTFQSIYLCQDSYESAVLSAGCLFQVVENVLTRQAQNGVALIRPPGHHAEDDEACGFCIFNNVALAAKLAITRHHLSRVLIVDWDVHHGNGIQHMFENDPRVLYISIHRYDRGFFFPCSEDANYDVVGQGAGKGFNVNIPWNKSGMGDGDYITAFTQVVLPIAYQFNPELVLVSAGFDAARGDPLGGCHVSPEAYGHMTQLLSGLANGKIVLALEGGYNLASISQAMLLCTRVLLGMTCPPLSQGLHPCPSAVSSILNVIQTQKQFWSAFRFQVDLPVLTHLESNGPASKSRISNKVDDEIEKTVLQLRELNVEDKEKASSEMVGATASSSKHNILQNLGFHADALGTQTVYAVEPLNWCPHLESVKPLPVTGINIKAPCRQCGDKNENWICLTCFEVYCGRFVNKDMLLHHDSTGHCLVMSFMDLSVWCYGCDAYIHNSILFPAIKAAHLQKFGEEMLPIAAPEPAEIN